MIATKDVITGIYRQEQSALGRQATHALRITWDQNIMPGSFHDTWTSTYPLMRDIVMYHYRASAASAAKFYRMLYSVEGRGVARVLSATPDMGKLDHVSDSVANGAFFHQLNKQQRTPGDASLIARNTLSGAGSRFALSGGRDTIIGTTFIDTNVSGWERLTRPSACGFCIMHAVRGPFKPGMFDFHPHDYCSCVAVPLFRGDKSVNAWLAEEWRQATQGLTGKEARGAWERYRGEDHGDDTTSGDGGGQTASEGQGSGDVQSQWWGSALSDA